MVQNTEKEFDDVSNLNFANIVTVTRLVLVPVLVVLLQGDLYGWFMAVGAFAVYTDRLDGDVARRFNQRTKLGTMLDPTVDKAMMAAIGVALLLEFWGVTWFVLLLFAILLVEVAAAMVTVYALVVRKFVINTHPAGRVGICFRAAGIYLMLVALFWPQWLDPAPQALGILLSYVGIIYGVHVFIIYARTDTGPTLA